MSKTVFFAGGGTGGHIYPALAVAERLNQLAPQTKIHFLCSERPNDAKILTGCGYNFTALPAVGLAMTPAGVLKFARGFVRAHKIARETISEADDAVVVGVGGFVAAPACRAGRKLGKKVYLINVDLIPGKANKLIAKLVDRIFAQFDDTRSYFGGYSNKVTVTGCPLRKEFENPNPLKIVSELGINQSKKILLITGASSGSASINQAVSMLLGKLVRFAENWQVVHIAGRANYDDVAKSYNSAPIEHKVLDYCDDMPSLLAAAELVVGRSGAVSVAEYAAASAVCICMPYPHHKDLHQYKNAAILVEAGSAVIVDDLPDHNDRADRLLNELDQLMTDDKLRNQMRQNTTKIADNTAARKIAEYILNT